MWSFQNLILHNHRIRWFLQPGPRQVNRWQACVAISFWYQSASCHVLASWPLPTGSALDQPWPVSTVLSSEKFKVSEFSNSEANSICCPSCSDLVPWFLSLSIVPYSGNQALLRARDPVTMTLSSLSESASSDPFHQDQSAAYSAYSYYYYYSKRLS